MQTNCASSPVLFFNSPNYLCSNSSCPNKHLSRLNSNREKYSKISLTFILMIFFSDYLSLRKYHHMPLTSLILSSLTPNNILRVAVFWKFWKLQGSNPGLLGLQPTPLLLITRSPTRTLSLNNSDI